jgi:glycosyltransferase involved in cell wall biosynthesis
VRTERLGWVGAEARNAALRQADALLFPSLWPEPFGLSGIEAGCFGVPAAGFGVGGTVDWLRAGDSGEIADERSAPALGAALARLLHDDVWQARRRRAWESAREFSPQRHLAALLRALQAGAA